MSVFLCRSVRHLDRYTPLNPLIRTKRGFGAVSLLPIFPRRLPGQSLKRSGAYNAGTYPDCDVGDFTEERSATFVFLGYEFRQATSLGGNDIVSAKMSRKQISRIVKDFSQWCRDFRDKRIAWIMGMVKAKLRGIGNYFNLPGNSKRRHEVELLYRRTLNRWLNRRSERKSYNWRTFSCMWAQFMYKPKYKPTEHGQQMNLWDCPQ